MPVTVLMKVAMKATHCQRQGGIDFGGPLPNRAAMSADDYAGVRGSLVSHNEGSWHQYRHAMSLTTLPTRKSVFQAQSGALNAESLAPRLTAESRAVNAGMMASKQVTRVISGPLLAILTCGRSYLNVADRRWRILPPLAAERLAARSWKGRERDSPDGGVRCGSDQARNVS